MRRLRRRGRRWVDQLSFRARVVLTILIIASTIAMPVRHESRTETGLRTTAQPRSLVRRVAKGDPDYGIVSLDRHCGWSCRPRAATTASSPASDLSPRIRPALIAYREVSHPADSPPERRPNSSQGVRFLPGARFAVAIGAFAVRRLVAVVGQAHFPPVSTSP